MPANRSCQVSYSLNNILKGIIFKKQPNILSPSSQSGLVLVTKPVTISLSNCKIFNIYRYMPNDSAFTVVFRLASTFLNLSRYLPSTDCAQSLNTISPVQSTNLF